MLVQINIERQPVIWQGNLTIDPQCCMITLAEEEISLYPKKFDALCLLTQYPGWVLFSGLSYKAVWQGEMGGGYVFYNIICQLKRKLKNPDMIQTVVGSENRFVG